MAKTTSCARSRACSLTIPTPGVLDALSGAQASGAVAAYVVILPLVALLLMKRRDVVCRSARRSRAQSSFLTFLTFLIFGFGVIVARCGG